jgi:transposase
MYNQGMSERKPYPNDVSDDEWAFVAPYLTLMTEDAPQRDYPLRGGIPWRLMPHDLPPWHTVYQQTQRGMKAGVFEAMVHDLREVLRIAEEREAQRYSTVVHCNPARKAVNAPDMMAPSGARVVKRTWRSSPVGAVGHCRR